MIDQVPTAEKKAVAYSQPLTPAIPPARRGGRTGRFVKRSALRPSSPALGLYSLGAVVPPALIVGF